MANEMLCPVDRTPLVMSERQNIEIDYCPTCRGVWLDRGELDKIIERSASASPASGPEPRAQPMGHSSPQPFGQGQGYGYGYGYRHKKKRKSFLEELFD